MIDFDELKKFFLFNLIGSLIIAAIIAVATVLFSTEFNEVTLRVFATLAMVTLHSLISLAFIWDDKRQKSAERLAFFTNVLFLIIVVSFVTSLLGIWKVIPGDIVGKLYQTMIIFGFAALHGNILAKALDKEAYLDMIVYINYVFMIAVVIMFQMVIYRTNLGLTLGESFFRLFAALGIIDGTLTILAVIFYKMHMNKHPKEENPLQGVGLPGQTTQQTKKGLSIWVWILIAYLILQAINIFSRFLFMAF